MSSAWKSAEVGANLASVKEEQPRAETGETWVFPWAVLSTVRRRPVIHVDNHVDIKDLQSVYTLCSERPAQHLSHDPWKDPATTATTTTTTTTVTITITMTTTAAAAATATATVGAGAVAGTGQVGAHFVVVKSLDE